jgi:hypothetical protein
LASSKNKPIRKNNRAENIDIATGAKTPDTVESPFLFEPAGSNSKYMYVIN